jgi:ribonuclease J
MEVFGIGGYSEVGKNMTAVKTGDDVFLFDAGFYMPAIVEMQEDEKRDYSEKRLRSKGALPNDLILDKLGLRNKVRAIFLSHGHLDHIGAIPYMSYRYNAPVIGSPFTISILKKILEDEKKQIPNKIITCQLNSSIKIKGKKKEYKAELINMTHSIPHTAMTALHTSEGIVVYGNDFKIDNTPVIGEPPGYKSLNRIAKQGVKVAIVDSLYSDHNLKTPSEKVARAMVEEVLLTVRNEKSALFVSTFSSHIARLKSIVEFGKKLDREILFVGRSLERYMSAASRVNLVPFKKDIQIKTYKNQVASALRQVSKNRSRYLVVCTGHQGEPGSILDRISRKKLPFEFQSHDNLVFSSKTIPVPVNIENRENMDRKLRKSKVRIFNEVHVSGHGGREDIIDLINIIKPQNIIPSHGPSQRLSSMLEICKDLGYNSKKEVHLMRDGKKIVL